MIPTVKRCYKCGHGTFIEKLIGWICEKCRHVVEYKGLRNDKGQEHDHSNT